MAVSVAKRVVFLYLTIARQTALRRVSSENSKNKLFLNNLLGFVPTRLHRFTTSLFTVYYSF
jgi:hypothetical protein